MTVAEMRAELEKRYSKSFILKMKDDQVIAVYRRIQSKKKN